MALASIYFPTLCDQVMEALATMPWCSVCFFALHTKSTAMVLAARSVHLTRLFPGQA